MWENDEKLWKTENKNGGSRICRLNLQGKGKRWLGELPFCPSLKEQNKNKAKKMDQGFEPESARAIYSP